MAMFFGMTILAPSTVFAAFAQMTGTTGVFTVSVSPQYPAPYSQITLTPLSSSINLTNAVMTVLVGGKQVYQGNAQPTVVSLGAAGSLTSINVIMASAGTRYTQALSIRPQDVALIAEPVASAPPLYPGEPLIPLGGEVRVVAVANLVGRTGKPLDPTTLSYSWTIDGTAIANASGVGKDVIMVTSPLQYRGRSVSLVVQSTDGSVSGGASLSLIAQEPTIRIYENNPLLGILYDHALSGPYTITGAETSFYGAPYSFPITNGAPSLQWFLNGTEAETGNSITLRPTGSGQGNASLSFVGSSGAFVKAVADLSVIFGSNSSGSLFGL